MILKKKRLVNYLLYIGIFSNLFLWDTKTFYISNVNEYLFHFYSTLRFILILPLIFILKKIKKEEITKVVLLFLFILFHYIIIYFLYSVKIEFINIIYCFVLSLFFLTVIKFNKLVFFYIKKSYQLFLFIFLTVILINFTFYNDSNFQNLAGCLIYNIKSFFFKEHSHFAYLSASILLYFLITSRVKFFIFLCLTIFSLSTTLIISLILNIILFFKKLIRFKYTLLFLLLFLSLIFFYKKECSQRLMGLNQVLYYVLEDNSKVNITDNSKVNIEENNNLTFLVYKNNLIISLQSIRNNILGWGFNNYSKAFFYYSDFNIDKLSTYYGTPLEYKILNYNDGRSNFFKIIVEFGVFFFYFYIFYFLFYFF